MFISTGTFIILLLLIYECLKDDLHTIPSPVRLNLILNPNTINKGEFISVDFRIYKPLNFED